MKSRIFFLFVLGIVLLLFGGCSHSPEVWTGSGTLEAKEILVSAEMGGTVVHVFVEEGDSLKPGQLMAQMETEKLEIQKRQLQAGLTELELNLENALRSSRVAKEQFLNFQKKFERVKNLFAEQGASQEQYDDAEIALTTAKMQYENALTQYRVLEAKKNQLKAQLELIQSQLNDATIVSPIQGTVLELFVDAGEMVRAGAPIATIADISHLWLKVYLTEKELGKIRLGGKASLFIASMPDTVFSGRITWISPKAEFTPKMVQTKEARSDLVYAVRIDTENPKGILKIGMPVDVEIRF